MAFMLLEAVRGKPMEERAQGEIVKWGFLSLIALMVVVLVNDVSAWVHGDLDFKKKDAKPKTSISTPKAEPKPEVKLEALPDRKGDVKPESTTETKVEPKVQTKVEPKVETQPAVKSDPVSSEAK